MHLEEFYDYKNRLVKDLLTDKDIVELIDPNHMYEDPIDMVYDNINPYEFYPETIEKGKVYVCCDVDVESTGERPYYTLRLHVWVFAHKSILPLPEGGVRTDKLCAAIDKKINGSPYYGLGPLELYSSKRFAPLADYTGKMLSYRATDFNRVHNYKKDRPANRKTER